MTEFDINSPSFQEAELRSECARVQTLLAVLGGLLLLVLLRGAASIAHGRHGEAWPFALLLTAVVGYEGAWLVFVRRTLASGRSISKAGWNGSVLLESLLPTTALFLTLSTEVLSPERTLTSPIVLVYLLLIMLSTLHLDPGISVLAGGSSAAGYVAVALLVFLIHPGLPAGERGFVYASTMSCAGLLVLGGIAAGGVARQIRSHVVAALRDAESRIKLAQVERDLGVARSIQQGLLPKGPPNVEGFDIAGWNQPADETGGDYFDWQELDDGRIAVTIADVAGHGIGPALCTAACRAYARAIFAVDMDPRKVLCRLNELLYEDLPSERFVTLAAGLLDPDEASLDLISAGHGPLLFYISAENRFRSYDAQGVPLGLLPETCYSAAQRIRFASGDMLALVTDGFIEWMNGAGEEFGQKRFKEVISANRERPASAIISEIYAALARFAGPAPQADDLTMVLIKRV